MWFKIVLFRQIVLIFVFILLINTVVSFECGVRKNINNAIVRGQSTSPGDWPWHAAIFHREGVSTSYACGGTLISELYVLTAVHCVQSDNGFVLSSNKIFVLLGIYNLYKFDPKAFQQHNIDTVHRTVKIKSQRNDIALLKLETQAEFTSYVQPACLNQVEDLTRQIGVAVGWGFDETDHISPVLKKATMPVVSAYECLEDDDFRQALDSSLFCAGYANGTSVCNGDSGGGLHFDRNGVWNVGGIVAFTKQRGQGNICHTESFAVFTNIYRFLPWIKSITNLQYLKDIETIPPEPVISKLSVDLSRNQLPKDCGKTLRDRISRGKTAKVFDYPWMAVLRYKFKNTFVDRCSGTIIHQRYILTAAQCIKTSDSLKIDHVILGEHTKNSEFDCNIYRGSNGEEIERECADRVNQYRVESYVIHPDFSETAFANDIGLIRLATEITWKYHIQPICLPVTPQLRVKQFKQYIVTGWGETEAGSEANELQEAILPQYSIAECQQRFSENDLGVTLGDKQICAGNVSRVNICSGDYGGPLSQMTNYNGVRFVQYGIVVMALDACGDLNIPTVFTRVSNYMDWILENVK